MERKIIFETVVGSHLYGTSRPESDYDFLGVFMPTEDDLFGLAGCPQEMSKSEKVTEGVRNSLGDVDRKFYSIKRYFDLLLTGQPAAVEMLFVPLDKRVSSSEAWEMIAKHKDKFISKQSVVPFLGFALSQSYKAFLKGGNLNLIRNLMALLKENESEVYQKTVGEICGVTKNTPRPSKCSLFGEEIDLVDSDNRSPVIQIAGRKYDINGRAKFLFDSLKELEGRYGTRSEAAATVGHDHKSLCHCFRLLGEARELLSTGIITLPRPPEQVEFLLAIRKGEVEMDFYTEINAAITDIKETVVPSSALQDEPDRKFANNLCIELIKESLAQQAEEEIDDWQREIGKRMGW
jgi:hypothetical protein